MKILLIGSGGREHSIALKLSESPLLTDLFIAMNAQNTKNIDLKRNVILKEELIDGSEWTVMLSQS